MSQLGLFVVVARGAVVLSNMQTIPSLLLLQLLPLLPLLTLLNQHTLPNCHRSQTPLKKQDAESKELALEAKRSAKLAEADEMAARLAELEAQLDDKRAEGEAVGGRRAALLEELGALLAEQDGFREALTRVFHRWESV